MPFRTRRCIGGILILVVFLFPGGRVGSSLAQISPEEATLYTFAVKAYQDGLYDLARQQFEQYLALFPQGSKRGEVYAYLGEFYSWQGEYEKAVTMYRQALRAIRTGEWLDNTRFMLGKNLYRLQQYEEAIQTLTPLTRRKGPLQEEALYWSGEAELNRGELAQARALFDRLLQESPQGTYAPYAYYARGWSWQKQGELVKALQDFQRIEISFSQSPLLFPAQLNMAQILFALERYAEAEEKFQWVLQRAEEPRHQEEALFGLAESLLLSQRSSEAIAAYEQYRRLFPHGQRLAAVLYNLGKTYYAREEFTKAIEVFQELRTRFPQDPSLEIVLLMQAQSYQALQQLEKAIETYSALILAFPEGDYLSKALLERGMLQYQLDRYPEARADFEMLQQRQNTAEIQMLVDYMLGEIFFQQKNYAEALPHYVAATTKGMEVPRHLWYKIGYIYSALERYPEAVEALEKYLAQPLPLEEQKVGFALLTKVLIQEGKYEEAIAKYHVRVQAFMNDKDTPALVQELAHLLLKLDKPEEAIATYEQWLHRSPPESNNEAMILELALLYRDQHDWESAQNMLHTLSQEATQDKIRAEALYWLADLYAQKGERSTALQILSEIPKAVPQEMHWRAIAAYRLGILYEEEHNWPAALDAYKAVIAIADEKEVELEQAAQTRLEELKALVAQKTPDSRPAPKQQGQRP